MSFLLLRPPSCGSLLRADPESQRNHLPFKQLDKLLINLMNFLINKSGTYRNLGFPKIFATM